MNSLRDDFIDKGGGVEMDTMPFRRRNIEAGPDQKSEEEDRSGAHKSHKCAQYDPGLVRVSVSVYEPRMSDVTAARNESLFYYLFCLFYFTRAYESAPLFILFPTMIRSDLREDRVSGQGPAETEWGWFFVVVCCLTRTTVLIDQRILVTCVWMICQS